MYMEHKGNLRNEIDVVGPARIGRVEIVNQGKILRYRGRTFVALSGDKWNYIDEANQDVFWIAGCNKDGKDALYSTDVRVDDNTADEYWKKVRKMPENVKTKSFKTRGKYGTYEG
jgi:hypothetical protein